MNKSSFVVREVYSYRKLAKISTYMLRILCLRNVSWIQKQQSYELRSKMLTYDRCFVFVNTATGTSELGRFYTRPLVDTELATLYWKKRYRCFRTLFTHYNLFVVNLLIIINCVIINSWQFFFSGRYWGEITCKRILSTWLFDTRLFDKKAYKWLNTTILEDFLHTNHKKLLAIQNIRT